MEKNTMAYFVSFETPLDTNQFISRWESYINSDGSTGVALYRSGTEGKYKYIARYLYKSNEFQFVVAKAAKTSRHAITEVRIRQLGGYSVVASVKQASDKQKDSKVFVFVTNPQASLAAFNDLTAKTAVNIYQEYYENCNFAYILEFFVKGPKIPELISQLEGLNEKNIEVYKECKLPVSYVA